MWLRDNASAITSKMYQKSTGRPGLHLFVIFCLLFIIVQIKMQLASSSLHDKEDKLTSSSSLWSCKIIHTKRPFVCLSHFSSATAWPQSLQLHLSQECPSCVGSDPWSWVQTKLLDSYRNDVDVPIQGVLISNHEVHLSNRLTETAHFQSQRFSMKSVPDWWHHQSKGWLCSSWSYGTLVTSVPQK